MRSPGAGLGGALLGESRSLCGSFSNTSMGVSDADLGLPDCTGVNEMDGVDTLLPSISGDSVPSLPGDATRLLPYNFKGVTARVGFH